MIKEVHQDPVRVEKQQIRTDPPVIPETTAPQAGTLEKLEDLQLKRTYRFIYREVTYQGELMDKTGGVCKIFIQAPGGSDAKACDWTYMLEIREAHPGADLRDIFEPEASGSASSAQALV